MCVARAARDLDGPAPRRAAGRAVGPAYDDLVAVVYVPRVVHRGERAGGHGADDGGGGCVGHGALRSEVVVAMQHRSMGKKVRPYCICDAYGLVAGG